MKVAHTLLAAYPLPFEGTCTATCNPLPALPHISRCEHSDGNGPSSGSPSRPVGSGGASTNGVGEDAAAAPLSPAPGARGLARALSRTDLASSPSAGHARLGGRAATPSASSVSASIPEGCENAAVATATNGSAGTSQNCGGSAQAERLQSAWPDRRSASGGPGDAVSLARGMGSVEMLDAGDDASTTPHASSSGGASPWGSAGKSSSSSLLSDATAFQV